MRRPITIALICLLFGAIINVLVAWACVIGAASGSWAFWSAKGVADRGTGVVRRVPAAGKRSITGFLPPPDWRPVEHMEMHNFGRVTEITFEDEMFGGHSRRVARDSDKPRPRTYAAIAGGFPFLSLAGSLNGSDRRLNAPWVAIEVPWLSLGRNRLPYQPLPVGFAANTLIYAALVALAWRVPSALRARSRRRKHLCVSCGYPITNASCPECGRADPSHASSLTFATSERSEVMRAATNPCVPRNASEASAPGARSLN